MPWNVATYRTATFNQRDYIDDMRDQDRQGLGQRVQREIVSGRAPDIWDLLFQSMNQYVQRSGRRGLNLPVDNKYRSIGYNGICLGLSIEWIRMYLEDTRIAAGVRIAELGRNWDKVLARRRMQSDLFHNKYSRDGGGDSLANTLKFAKYVGLLQHPAWREEVEFPLVPAREPRLRGSAWAASIRAAKPIPMPQAGRTGIGFLLGWARVHRPAVGAARGLGAHAIACAKAGGSRDIIFFEPNYGEYSIPSANLSGFLNDYFVHIGTGFPNSVPNGEKHLLVDAVTFFYEGASKFEQMRQQVQRR